MHVPERFARAWKPDAVVKVDGHASARNVLIDELGISESILFIDEDTLPMGDFDEFLSKMERSRYDIAVASVRGQNNGAILACCMRVNPKTLKALGKFRGYGPTEVLEDQDYFYRARLAGLSVGHAEGAWVTSGAETNQRLAGEAMMEFKRLREAYKASGVYVSG